MTLRPVNPADLADFHEVMMGAGMDPRSSWNRTTPDDLERSLFSPGAGGFLAERDGQVVGCVGYRPDNERTLTLNKLATRPEARGNGLGRALVREVEHVARMGGYARVLLAVSQYNLDVLPFYEKLGYTPTDEPYAHAHPDSPPPVVLVKILNQQDEIPAVILEEAQRLKLQKDAGESFTELAASIDTTKFNAVEIIIIFMKAFSVSMTCARDVMNYVLCPTVENLQRLAQYPEWQSNFGADT